MREDRYILRHVAGMDWLIKADQQDAAYVAPIAVNASGAMIWRGLEAGERVEDLTKMLQVQFGVDAEQALQDVTDFCQALDRIGIKGKQSKRG